jgi:hypothetical protein
MLGQATNTTLMLRVRAPSGPQLNLEYPDGQTEPHNQFIQIQTIATISPWGQNSYGRNGWEAPAKTS